MQNPEVEIWKPIEGYENRYEVSNHGRVKSLGRKYDCFGKKKCLLSEKIMKLHLHNNGYKVVWLRKDKTHVKFFVQRLVAEAFIPNPNAVPVVNHIDCDKTNNHIANLEWMTFSENTTYYYKKKEEDGVVF